MRGEHGGSGAWKILEGTGRYATFVRLAAATVAALGLAATAHARSDLDEPLAGARAIAAQVDSRFSGLRVTEASSTAVVDSLTLFGEGVDPRVVDTAEGVYYAVCPVRATCPFPGRKARSASALAPRRVALELAARTFAETAADLVVVSLPTPRFVLLVLERHELDADATVRTLEAADAEAVRAVVDDVTVRSLFEGVALAPDANGGTTLLAVTLGL